MKNKYSSASDNDLWHFLKAEDPSAFNEIYKRHWDTMFQSAYKVLKDQDSCMDIVQDIFIKLWENRENIEIKTSLKAYLFVAVKFRVANFIRHDKVKSSFFDKVAQLEPSESIETNSLEFKELKFYIEQFTEMLPGKCKEVFILSRNHYLSNKEIADRLGISLKTVENQMTIAIRKLKTNIAKILALLIFISL